MASRCAATGSWSCPASCITGSPSQAWWWLLLVLVTVSFLGETLSGYRYDEVPLDADAALSAPPSADHWFGTNELGVDVFSRVRNSWLAIVLVISGLAWMGVARIVRGVALSLRERDFVEAARAVGLSNRRIVLRHILPNCLGPIIVAGTLAMAGGILAEAALSFLGFGIQPPDASLGGLIAVGVPSAGERWWLFYPPGMFIVLFCLAINFIGDGLRDAFDPQQIRVRA